MAAQVADVLAGVRRVDLDGVAINRGEVLPPGGEAALAAGLDGKLLIRSDVVHEQVHQPELVRKAGEHVQPRRVEGDREALLGETLGDISAHVGVVPDAHTPVERAGGDERLADAGVQPSDRLAVERLRQQLEVHLVHLEDVRVGKHEHIYLRVGQRADELLLRR
eukprot:scaffold11690_cov108-Isochrysis_galbana.AAC.5